MNKSIHEIRFPKQSLLASHNGGKKKSSKDQLVNKVAKSTKLLINDLIATYKIVGKKNPIYLLHLHII